MSSHSLRSNAPKSASKFGVGCIFEKSQAAFSHESICDRLVVGVVCPRSICATPAKGFPMSTPREERSAYRTFLRDVRFLRTRESRSSITQMVEVRKKQIRDAIVARHPECRHLQQNVWSNEPEMLESVPRDRWLALTGNQQESVREQNVLSTTVC
jgi:hypothetical protein